MIDLVTTAEERAKVAQCRSCFGRGMRYPTCFRCNDSTDDHECPPEVTCGSCNGSGNNPEVRRILDDLSTLLAEVERLRSSLREACIHLDMAVEASEESGEGKRGIW